MNHNFRRFAALLMISMIAVFAVACTAQDGDLNNAQNQTLYLFNSKGENAEAFKKMCEDFTKETGIPTSAFSVGAGQDAQEPLRTQMNSVNPPAIFSLQGLKELPEWKESGRIVDLSSVENEEMRKLADAIPESMRLSDDGKSNYGIPFNVEGYGYMVDQRMIADLFSGEQQEAVIEGLKQASYEEFIAFCDAVTQYIETPAAKTIEINGKPYTFTAQKTERTKKLNGVFAFAGSEKWTYGDHLINVALNTVFPDARSAQNATEAQLESLRQPLVAYAKALDYVSSHAGGIKGSAKRGNDLINAANFGYDQSVQSFADGNALFLQQGNWAYANIEKVSKDVAENAVFLPIKLPITDAMIKTGKTAKEMNSSIPVYVPNYYVINAKAPKEAQENAIRFLLWMQKPENVQKYVIEAFHSVPYMADEGMKLDDSLSVSIMEYLEEGKTLSAPYHGAPNIWSSEVVGKELMEKYLTKSEWTEDDYHSIADFAITRWKNMR